MATAISFLGWGISRSRVGYLCHLQLGFASAWASLLANTNLLSALLTFASVATISLAGGKESHLIGMTYLPSAISFSLSADPLPPYSYLPPRRQVQVA